MEIRNLGTSGLKVSAISYGNWLTHGSQVEEDAATRLRAPRPRRGHHDLRHRRRLRRHRGRDGARQGAGGGAARGARDLHQGLLARPARARTTTTVCRASTSWSRSTPRCVGCRPTTSTSTRRTATTTRRRWRRRWRPSPTSCRAGKAHYIGVSEWRAEEIRAAHALARELHVPLVSNQPQYNLLWRVIESEVVPTCEELGIGQVVWSPIAQGVLTGKYRVGQDHPSGLARDRREGRRQDDQPLAPGRRAPAGRAARAARRPGRADDGPARGRLGAAEPERVLGDHRRQPPRAGQRQRQGRRRAARRRPDGGHRRGRRRRSSSATRRRRPHRRGASSAEPGAPLRSGRARSAARPSRTAPHVETTRPSSTTHHHPGRTVSPEERHADGRRDEGLPHVHGGGGRRDRGAVHAERVEPEGHQAEGRHREGAGQRSAADRSAAARPRAPRPPSRRSPGPRGTPSPAAPRWCRGEAGRPRGRAPRRPGPRRAGGPTGWRPPHPSPRPAAPGRRRRARPTPSGCDPAAASTWRWASAATGSAIATVAWAR